MLIFNKEVKYFLSGILILMACLSLNAEEVGERSIIFESKNNAVVFGREYLVVGSASENKDTLQKQILQPKISSKGSSHIYIAENAKIYGKEYLYDKEGARQTFAKNDYKPKSKSITTEPAANNSNKNETPVIVFPDFPFLPSSSSYFQYDKESAITTSQQESKKYQPEYKIYINSNVEKTNLSFLPEQRHKFSPAATQCGILTSFISNAPPL